jgi:hypothetical protein
MAQLDFSDIMVDFEKIPLNFQILNFNYPLCMVMLLNMNDDKRQEKRTKNTLMVTTDAKPQKYGISDPTTPPPPPSSSSSGRKKSNHHQSWRVARRQIAP